MFKSAAYILDNDSVVVCRLCLSEEGDLVYIFNPKGYQGFQLWKLIEELLQEEVSKEDGLPWSICKGCVSKVMEFKHFKTACIQAKLSLLTKMANRGLEFIIKEEVNADESLSEAETHNEEILRKDGSAYMRASNDASLADPLDLERQFQSLIDIKEDVDVVESHSEADTYHQENHEEYGSLDLQVSNVVCLPIVKEEMVNVKEDVTTSESSPEAEITSEENFQEVESSGEEVSNMVSSPLQMRDLALDGDIGAEGIVSTRSLVLQSDEEDVDYILILYSGSEDENKDNGQSCEDDEEDDPRESLAGVEAQEVVNLAEDESRLTSVATVIGLPTSVENLVHGCSMREGSQEMCVEIVSDLIQDRNINIRKTFEKNTSICSVPGENSLRNMKKLSVRKGENLKSCECITSAYKFSDMMPSKLSHLESYIKRVGEFICDYCGVKCTDKNNFVTHVRGHISRNSSSTRVMLEHSYLKCSETRITGIQSTKPLDCEISFKKLNRKVTLLEHSEMHRDLKLFKCDICRKRFQWKSHLARHKVVHSSFKTFKCETCGKGFTRKHCLVKHSVIHSGLRPFKCETCGKRFTQKSSLVTHSMIHSGLRPFKCDSCGKGYTRKYDLVAHSVMHSGLRPFKCETCGKEFKWRTGLRKHSTIHI